MDIKPLFVLCFAWSMSLLSMTFSYPVRYRRGDNAWNNPGDVVDVNYHTIITKTIGVPVPQQYTVVIEKHVPIPVKVPYPIHIDRPYPVHVAKTAPVHVNEVYHYVDRPTTEYQQFPPVFQSHGSMNLPQHQGYKSHSTPALTSYSVSNHRFGSHPSHSSW